MEGPSATVALVLAEAAAGGTALLWAGGLWGSVKRGFFLLTGASVLALVLLSILAAASTVDASNTAVERAALVVSSVFAGALGLSLAGLILRADVVGRVFGLLAIPAGIAALGVFAEMADELRSFGSSLAQLLAGAAFLGAVLDGLLLGHWYLTDRRLPRDHIRRFSTVLLVAVGIEAVALLVLGLTSAPTDSAGFSVILGVTGLTTWLALGMAACTGLIAFLIRASLRGESSRAVQGATGFFYLAVITAFTAEMAAKVGFLG